MTGLLPARNSFLPFHVFPSMAYIATHRRWIAASLAGSLLVALGVWVQTSNADPTGTGPNDKYIARSWPST